MEKKNKIKFKSRLKNTAAVNQSSGKGTAVFLADEGSKSCVSIYNYRLLKPVSISLQLCSLVYPSLKSVLCFVIVLV